MIPVTKPHLPNRQTLDRYLDGIYERAWFTNNGQLVQELTRRLEEYLEVENLLLVANGTLALQIAYRALGVSGRNNDAEAITTPFTFVATASSLKWEGVEPVFVDIDKATWCLNPNLIEQAITPHTKAIVPVHVFGNACDVEAIDNIAKQYNIKVIYDASHAFGVRLGNKSLLQHGDAATLSFHATKLFHTGEGGAIVFRRKEDLERAKKIINFGITGPETIDDLGINAKMSELQAAMGLSVLDDMDQIARSRRTVTQRYDKYLLNRIEKQLIQEGITYNNAYYPIALADKAQLKEVIASLNSDNIMPRRYFYPSLEKNNFLSEKPSKCPISESLSNRILCLPIYSELEESAITQISNIVIKAAK